MCLHAHLPVCLHACEQAAERPKLSFSIVHIFVKFAAEADAVLAVFSGRWMCELFYRIERHMHYCCSQRAQSKFFAACESWLRSALSIKPNVTDFINITAKKLQPALIVNVTIEFKTVQSLAERDIIRKLEDAKPDFQFEGIEPEAISMSGSCLDGTQTCKYK